MALRTGTKLACSCCGNQFQVWDGYQDQDQDKGYGICQPCQDYEAAENEKLFDQAFALVEDTLSVSLLTRWHSYDRELKKALVLQMIQDGVIKFYVSPRTSEPSS